MSQPGLKRPFQVDWLKINMKTLIGFSLIETEQIEGSYAMHPVVQNWYRYIANTDKNVDLIQLNELTLISVGYMVPSGNDRCYAELQSRLIPHANSIFHWSDDNNAVSRGLYNIGCLYYDQDKLKEEEETFQQALIGKRKALGPDNISTLDTVNNLGVLYSDQRKLKEAEMYLLVLADKRKTLHPDYTSIFYTVTNIGLLYKDQGKPKEAEDMYQQALAGYEKALGPDNQKTQRVAKINCISQIPRLQGVADGKQRLSFSIGNSYFINDLISQQ